MTDKKLSGTQKIDKLSAEELRGLPKSVGKRVFGNVDQQRGLAAFDKQPPNPKAVPGGRDSIDHDLMRERLAAHDVDEDDGMVPTSSSFWGDEPHAPGSGKGGSRKAAAVEVAEEEETEEAPPKRGGATKWIVGGILVAGLGVGGYFGVSALTATPAPVVETKAPPKKPAPPAEDDEPEADEGKADEAKVEKVAPDKAEADKPEAAKAEADKPEADKPVADKPAAAEKAGGEHEQPLKSAPEIWAASVTATNPWVVVAAAPAGKKLGLSESEMSDDLASSRTGIQPGKLAAPTHGYRMQAHEVTWGELGLATTLAEVATIKPPSWLPKAAAAHAKLPATNVPWSVALSFCKGMGGDLPSEAEWEWVARGPEDRYFPWGRDAFGPDQVHIFADRVLVVAVTSATLDRTASGISDLLGNAQEWTRNAFRGADLSDGPKSATHKAVRGWPLNTDGRSNPAEGSTYRSPGCADATCAAGEARALERIGFRCVATE